MVGYAAQKPTLKAHAGQHSVHAHVLRNQNTPIVGANGSMDAVLPCVVLSVGFWAA